MSELATVLAIVASSCDLVWSVTPFCVLIWLALLCRHADARSSLSHDRIQQFLLLLYGHAANYQGRGSFISNEQQSLYQDPHNPSWRASLGEIQASFCTPSQTLVASMTAMQLVSYDRQHATIWLARG
eukprot:COSAG01_NODE_26932_length_699_cov_0.920000_1_plen_127_part_10